MTLGCCVAKGVQIMRDRPLVQDRILGDDRRRLARPGKAEVEQVHAVDRDRTSHRLHYPKECDHEGGLSRASPADDARALTCSEAEGDPIEHQREPWPIAHTHVPELDAARRRPDSVSRGRVGGLRACRLLRQMEELEKTLKGRQARDARNVELRHDGNVVRHHVRVCDRKGDQRRAVLVARGDQIECHAQREQRRVRRLNQTPRVESLLME